MPTKRSQSSQDSRPPAGGLSGRLVLQLSAGVILIAAVVMLVPDIFTERTPSLTPQQLPERPASQPAPAMDLAGDPEAPVEVSLEPPAYDFGFLRPEEAVTRTVRLTNLEPGPIRLNGIARGCSCTTMDIRPQVILPGAFIDVPATLTAGLTPTDKTSSMKVEVVGRPPIVLPVKGEIIRGVRASPRDIDTYRFRGAERNYIPTGRIVLDAPEGPPFRILSINGVPETTAPAARHVVTWDVSEFDPVTGLNDAGEMVPRFWLVETDHPETPVMELRVSHRALRPDPVENRPWFFLEQRVNVGGIAMGGAGQFVLPIKWKGGEPRPESIAAVRSESDAFTATLLKHISAGRESRATIQIRPVSGHEGPFEGMVTIVGEELTWPLPVIGHAPRTESR